MNIGLVALMAALVIAACGGSSHVGTTKDPVASGQTQTTSTAASATGPAATGSRHHKSAARSGSAPGAAHHRASAKGSGHAGRLPSGSVATVAGQPISLAAYDTAYHAQFASLSSGGVPLDPPGYSRCVAAYGKLMGKLQAKLPKKSKSHIPTPSHAQLLKDCQERDRGIKQSVMSQLIQQRWTLGAAQADHIVVSQAEVSRTLASQEKAMGGAAKYAKYLGRVKQTRAQVMATTRLSLIEQALQKRRLGAPAHVSAAQVAAFFSAHHAEFVLPHQKHPKLSTYAPRIRLLLQEQVQSRHAEAANLAYEHHWRSETVCSPGYVVSLCSNGPR